MSKVSHAVLDIILPLSNPRRFKRREELFKQALERIDAYATTHGLTNYRVHPVEGAFGDRDYAIEHPNAIRVQLKDELWSKENLLNIAISRLPPDWKSIAWIDADITFTNPAWIAETIEMLQHHPVVQPWSDCLHLGPKMELLSTHRSFGYCNMNNVERMVPGHDTYGTFWHPGFAWAARREVIEAGNGLIDWAVLGSADHHMALAMINSVHQSVGRGLGPGYYAKLKEYQANVFPVVKGDIGYVPGTILHHYHGRLGNRKYKERWSIMTDAVFDPNVHIAKDFRGVYQFTDAATLEFKNAIREYFIVREEDANTL